VGAIVGAVALRRHRPPLDSPHNALQARGQSSSPIISTGSGRRATDPIRAGRRVPRHSHPPSYGEAGAHGRSAAGALPRADFWDIGAGLVVVDVVVGTFLCVRPVIEIGEAGAHGLVPPERASHSEKLAPASRSSANRPTSRTAASGQALAGRRRARWPKVIFVSPTCPPSKSW